MTTSLANTGVLCPAQPYSNPARRFGKLTAGELIDYAGAHLQLADVAAAMGDGERAEFHVGRAREALS